jgi:amino acid adenylation domain-containing protein
MTAGEAVKDPAALSRGDLDQLIRRLRDKRSGAPGARPAAARTPPPLPRRQARPAGERYELSFSQQRLWFLSQLEAFSPAYNIAGALDLRGPLDHAALAAALAAVVERHEALRTRFGAAGGAPFQAIDPPAPAALPQVDLAALPAAAGAAAAAALAGGFARRPFDLAAAWPLRALLLREGEERHRLLVAIHHIAADGRSLEIFLDELAAAYAAAVERRPAELPELPYRFVDFAAWERLEAAGGALARHLDYWRARLAGAPAALELPADRPRPARLGWRGGSQPLALPGPLARQLVALGRRQGATPFMTLLAGIQLLLWRHGGQPDLVVGTAVENRNLGGTERLVGCFVNLLALRADLGAAAAAGAGFEDLVARVRAATLADMAHQEMPFDKLIEELQPERWLSRTPLFQAAFVLQGRALAGSRAGALTLAPAAVETGTAKFDLTFDLAGGEEGFAGRLEFSSDLFDRATAIRLGEHLATLLAAAAARPEAPLGELPLLAAGERAALLREWNDTRSPYPRERCIHELFAEVAARRPEAVAVAASGGEALLTYAELARRAKSLARRLRRMGVAPEVPVAVLCERSPELVVAVLGILESGGAYVPLDPGHPPQRLAYVLGDAGCPVLVGDPRLLAALPPEAFPERRPRVVSLDRGGLAVAEVAAGAGEGEAEAEEAAEGESPRAAGAGPDSLAYVMYTSGSTGVPKGVAVTHRAVVRLVRETGYARFGPEEVFLLLAPPAFDASTLELWGPLLNGGRLVIHDRREPDLAALGEVLAATGVTTLWLTAGLFHQMVDNRLAGLRPVRQLLAGGDVLSPPHVRRVLAELPGVTVINGYGPTEGTTFTCCQPLRSAGEVGAAVAIGRPIANTVVQVVDGSGQLAPVGVAGELVIGGDGLARGYLRRPDWTAERFVPDPFGDEPGRRLYRTGDRARWLADGRLEFLGRLDRQVKVRGFRIEPGEIERVLAAHPEIESCAVVTLAASAGAPPGGADARPAAPADLRLVAYLVARDAQAPPDGAAVRSFLRERLPEPLVPSAFVWLPALPLTPNGKIDRAALPAPSWTGEAERPRRLPRNPEEELLASLFADLLPDAGQPPGEEEAGAGEPGAGRLGEAGEVRAGERRPGAEPAAAPAPAWVSIDDDFFALGGHSLLATRLVSRVRDTFGVELPVRAVFEAPTVAALAERLRGARATEGGTAGVPPPPLVRRQPAAGPAAPADIAPLSFAQERLWFLAQLEPESTAYHIGVAARLRGRLDVAALAAALGEVVRRHEALRTVFGRAGQTAGAAAGEGGGPAVAASRPVQRILPPSPATLPALARLDLAVLPAGRREEEAAAVAGRWCERPFDLEKGPLLRPLLVELGTGESLLVLALHHIVADGWSMGVLLRELGALYLAAAAARAPGAAGPDRAGARDGASAPDAGLAPLAIQYADFACWQRQWLSGEELDRQLAYWQRQLAGLAQLDLPVDRPPAPAAEVGAGAEQGAGAGSGAAGQAPARRAARRPLDLSAELAAGIAALSRREGVTPFMALLAGVQALLGRYTGQADVAVGSPIANRNRAEIEPLIGLFVNTLVLRTGVGGDPSGRELLGRVREAALGAYAHQDLPFEKLVERLAPERDLLGTPLFRVLVAVQGGLWRPLALPGLELSPEAVPGRTAKFDLSLTWMPESGWRGELEYRRDLFDGATMARLWGQLEALLGGLAAAPERRLSELPWLGPGERAALLWEWNDAEWARQAEGWGGTVHQRVSAVAARQPLAVAVVAEGAAAATYGEIERRSNRLAWRLRRLGVGEESLVGVCVERGLALVPALLGVHKAGAAYLPLDPELPRERLAAILGDARPRAVIADEQWQPLLGELLGELAGDGAAGRPVAMMGIDGEPAGAAPAAQESPVAADAPADATVGAPAALRAEELAPPEVELTAESLAYVLFTSGSTGRPKGVAVPHGALMNVLGWVSRELGLEAVGGELALLAVTTLSFDIAAVELLLPLLVGGRVELAGREVAGDGARLRRELVERRATLLQATPVTWRLLLEAGWEGEGELRWGITCGEALSAELAERLLARRLAPRPGGGLWNLYGPTETAIFSAGRRVERRELSAATGAPVGGAVANTRLYVLDGELGPLPAGVTGELYIGGEGVARGYVGRPDLTAERFVPDPWSPAGGGRLYRSGDLARRRPDGVIEYLGRADHQVKLRGYRIELGEIEAVLARHPAVRECVVVARGEGDQRQLVAYLAPRAAAPAAALPAAAPPAGDALGGAAIPGAPSQALSTDLPATPPLPEPPRISVLELRGHLQRQLPAYMVPAVFVALPELPHTPSGKVDRKALPEPDAGGQLSASRYVAPRTADEQVLMALWSELLDAAQVEQAGAAADFFALGGHSLLATQLLSRVRDAFGLELPVRSVFECPTVAAFAARLAEHRRRAAGAPPTLPPIEPLPPAARRGRLPLSFAQERLWFLDQLQPGNAAYNMPIAVRLRGALDAGRFRRCLEAVAARHESLRTTFHAADGQPFQRILPALRPGLPQVDLGALPAERRAAESRRLAEAEAATPFDLERGPLLRVRLVRLEPDRQLLLLNLHHIVSDGWSIRLLLAELAELYGAEAAGLPLAGAAARLPELPVQYADYAAWQRRWLDGEVFARQLAYWRRELGGDLPVLDLPLDSPRPAVQTFHGGAQQAVLAAPLAGALRSLSRREGASLFMTLLAGFAALLGRFGGQEDLLMGIPIAGRHHREIEPLIGFFLNSLVLRTDLSGRPTFRELLRRVRRAALDAYAHQDLPFERLLQELQPERDLSRTPLFQVYFNYQNLPEPRFALPGVEIEQILDVEELSKFDLTLYVSEDGGEVRLHLVYNAGLFSAARIAEALRQYASLLEQVAAGPDAPVASCSLVTAAARRLLPDPALPLDDGWVGAVHEHFAAWARRAPERLAVADPAGSWTYGELERQSNRLAHRLLAAGVGGAGGGDGRGWRDSHDARQAGGLHDGGNGSAGGDLREDTVAIYAHRSATLVWAVLGVLKAGAAFILLDPAYPAARLIDVVRLARPRAWLELEAAGPPAPELAAAVAALPSCLRLRLPPWHACDAGGGPLAAWPDTDPAVPTGPERLAYIAFTSGSTGLPKGVLGRHGPLSHFLPWQTAELGLRADDRFSLLSGLSHDPLQRDLFTPLFLGAAICIPDPAEIIAVGRLAAWMREARVSVAHLTPAMGQLLTEGRVADDPGDVGERGERDESGETGDTGDAVGQGDAPLPCDAPLRLAELRFVLLVGDVLTRRDVDRLQRLAPRVTVVNLYGSTETQRAVGYHVAARGDAAGAGAGACAAAGALAGAQPAGAQPAGAQAAGAQTAAVPAAGAQGAPAPAPAQRSKEILPCGRGMKDVQLLVFGGSGQLAGVGEVGEVGVRSPHLARGYLGDPQSTAERFQLNPFTGRPGDRVYRTGDLGRYLPDGEVAFAGRADTQVKIRGYRIELGEIEAQIGRLPAVRESVVVAAGSEAADKRLVAFVVPQPGAELAAPQLRAHLRQALPAFMVPAAFQLLSSLPLTPNGKVNRKLLLQRAQAPVEAAVDYIAPRNEMEAGIADILRDVLKIDRVGVEDNFFELGGNSLLLVQAQSRLQAAFHRELPVFELFNNPTVRDLARYLGAGRETPAPPRPEAAEAAAAQLRVGKDRLRRRLAKALDEQRSGGEEALVQ